MREAGRLLEIVHNQLGEFIKPGITTLDIDRLGEKLIRNLGCTPNFLHYNGYPASICVSVNDRSSWNPKQKKSPSGRGYCQPGCRTNLQRISF